MVRTIVARPIVIGVLSERMIVVIEEFTKDLIAIRNIVVIEEFTKEFIAVRRIEVAVFSKRIIVVFKESTKDLIVVRIFAVGAFSDPSRPVAGTIFLRVAAALIHTNGSCLRSFLRTVVLARCKLLAH